MVTYHVKSKKFHIVGQEREICQEVEKIAAHFSLDVKTKTTLSTKQGSHHWHLKNGDTPGILEITFWPKKGEFRIDIHKNRRSEWNLSLIEPLAVAYAGHFEGAWHAT